MPALAGEPGRSLCQDISLGLQAAHLLAQLLELATLLRAQRARLGQRARLLVRTQHRSTPIGQCREPSRSFPPGRDRLLRAAELHRQILDPPARRVQLHDLLAKLRRVRRPWLSTHVGLLSVRIIESVRKFGVTSIRGSEILSNWVKLGTSAELDPV